MEKEIITDTVKTSNFSIIFISVLLGGTYLSFALGAILQNAAIAAVGLICFAMLPLILMKKIINLFTKTIKITFYDEYFSITLLNKGKKEELGKKKILYENLDSCTINPTQNGYLVVYFTLYSGKINKYTLKTGKNEAGYKLGKLIYENIKLRKKSLILKPTFFSSKKAPTYIIALAVLMILLISLHVFYSPESSPLTLILSLSLFVNILVKRKKEIETFRRLKMEN